MLLLGLELEPVNMHGSAMCFYRPSFSLWDDILLLHEHDVWHSSTPAHADPLTSKKHKCVDCAQQQLYHTASDE